MSRLLRDIKSLFPASRRAARELAEAQTAKQVQEVLYRTKVVLRGGVLGVVGITALSLDVLVPAGTERTPGGGRWGERIDNS